MTLEEIKEIAKALIIVREFIGNTAEDSKAIQSGLERALILVHNEAIEAAESERRKHKLYENAHAYSNQMRTAYFTGAEEMKSSIGVAIRALKLPIPPAEQDK